MFRLRGVLDGKGPGASSVTGAARDGGGWRDACPSPGHGRTADNQVKTSLVFPAEGGPLIKRRLRWNSKALGISFEAQPAFLWVCCKQPIQSSPARLFCVWWNGLLALATRRTKLRKETPISWCHSSIFQDKREMRKYDETMIPRQKDQLAPVGSKVSPEQEVCSGFPSL